MEQIPVSQSSTLPTARSLITSEVQVQISDFARRLRDLKNLKGWKVAQLARELGVPARSLKDWIEGAFDPKPPRKRELEAKIAGLMSRDETVPLVPAAPEPAPESVPEAESQTVGEAPPLIRSILPEDKRWEI